MTMKQLSDLDSDGTGLGQSATDKIGFFGLSTNVVQQTAGTDAPAISSAGSGSTIIASIEAIALGAASLANANAATLTNLGLQA